MENMHRPPDRDIFPLRSYHQCEIIIPSGFKDAPTDTNPCVICLENKKSCVLLPCSHLCLCAKCSQQCTRQGSLSGEMVCPICRTTVTCIRAVFD